VDNLELMERPSRVQAAGGSERPRSFDVAAGATLVGGVLYLLAWEANRGYAAEFGLGPSWFTGAPQDVIASSWFLVVILSCILAVVMVLCMLGGWAMESWTIACRPWEARDEGVVPVSQLASTVAGLIVFAAFVLTYPTRFSVAALLADFGAA